MEQITAALHNLGCKVNEYETKAMEQMLEQAGYHIVPFSEKADVYVINTCSVTNMADRKSRQMIHRAKKKNPQSIVVAAGCYVQTSNEKAMEDLSIDILLGNNQKYELINKINEYRQQKGEKNSENIDELKVMSYVDVNHTKLAYENLAVYDSGDHTRAFVKVQDGCNQFCSYCIIPYARGRVRSRSLEEVKKEVVALAKTGVKEVVITGIHLSSYGINESYNGNVKKAAEALLQLIQEIHSTEGIERIRLGSLEPQIITQEFVNGLRELEKICPHFHLSLQSGCDAILKRMNRQYTKQEFKNSCERLRKTYFLPAITTDVIVGFPGETQEEFLETKDFLREISFYEMHVFPFSKRKGTKAADMKPQISEDIKQKRSKELLELDKELSLDYEEQLKGKQVEVLLETPLEIEGHSFMTGYTKEYVRVLVDNQEQQWNANDLLIGEYTKELYETGVLKNPKLK